MDRIEHAKTIVTAINKPKEPEPEPERESGAGIIQKLRTFINRGSNKDENAE